MFICIGIVDNKDGDMEFLPMESTELESDSLSVERTAYVFFETGDCTNTTKHEQDYYWTAVRCGVNDFPAQVKVTTGGNFILCPFQNIIIDRISYVSISCFLSSF